MNWHALAVHLADRLEGCIFVDRQLRVQLFSLGLERLLGWSRDEIEGQPILNLVPADHRLVAHARLLRAVGGLLPAFVAHLQAKDGRLLAISFEGVRLEHQDDCGLFLTVTASRSIRPETTSDPYQDVTYEIAASPNRFGELRSMRSLTANDPTTTSGQRCYQLMHGRDQPCTDCPALQASEAAPRTLTRRVPADSGTYEVLTAIRKEERATVHVRRISDVALSAIYEAKVSRLADAAQLSEREREVLHWLLLGRALGDVALLMNLSVRTVKFHQANILEKLGVDSRVDLIRLIV